MGDKIGGMGDDMKRKFSMFVKKFNQKGGSAPDHESRGLLQGGEEEVMFSPMGHDESVRESGEGMEMGDFGRRNVGSSNSNSNNDPDSSDGYSSSPSNRSSSGSGSGSGNKKDK